MQHQRLARSAVLVLVALAGTIAVGSSAIPASAGKEVFVRSKPHVAPDPTRPLPGRLTSPQPTAAGKWCGPGGRLCIEDGRWTWKKKKKK